MTIIDLLHEMPFAIIITEIKQIDIYSLIELHTKLVAVDPAHRSGNDTKASLFNFYRLPNLQLDRRTGTKTEGGKITDHSIARP